MSSGTAVLCEPTFDANKSERTFDANKSGTGYISKRVAIQDCSFLLGIVLLSCLSYVGRLGFYSDDWDTWALFYGAKDQSLGSLMRATISRHLYPERPVKMAYLALTYIHFGLHPLLYHLTITLALAGTAVLFYAALRELQLPHCITLTVPLVYALLPHYATDRFWIAAHGTVLSQAFFLLGFYTALRAVRAGRGWALCLQTVSILSFSLALLSYELIIGLLPVCLLLIGYHMYTKRYRNGGKPHALIFPDLGYLVIAGACLGLTLLFKVHMSPRATFQASPTHFGEVARGLVGQTVRFNLGRYGAALPRTAFVLYRFSGAGRWLAILAAVIAISVLLYLSWTFRRSQSTLLSRNGTLYLIATGFVLFLFAYVPLTLLSNQLYFTIEGYGNRVTIAAATGTAFVLVGGIMLLIRAVKPPRLQSLLFCGAIAALCAMNFVCFASLGECWAKAYTQQREIVLEVRKNVDLAPGSTLLIDGFCRYVGPAPVIEGYVDAGSLLQIAYADETLKGDVVSPYLEISDDAIITTVYGNQVNRYPYSEKLWLYNVRRKITLPLPDSRVASNYFRTMNSDQNSGCPVGTSFLGRGSLIPGMTVPWAH
jgi:hypothetical protein